MRHYRFLMIAIPAPVPGTRTNRDSALDGLRALAIARVITWHASGWPWTTWVISAVPAMFAVSGALMARSTTHIGAWSQTGNRVRRLVWPMWAYGVAVWTLSTFTGASCSPLWTFFLPFVQPHSDLAGTWFTSALWYLTAYWWILLLSPALLSATRKWGHVAPAMGSCLVVVCGSLGWDEGPNGRLMGDVILYATFAMWGMTLLRSGRPDPRTIRLPAVAAFAGTIAWLLLRRDGTTVVNDDHVLHMFVGGFWMLVLLQMPGVLSWVARTTPARFLNGHPLTIYLWHPGVAWLMWQLVPHRIPDPARTVVIIAMTFVLLPGVVFCTGWIEKRRDIDLSVRPMTARILVGFFVVAALMSGPVSSRLDLFRGSSDIPLPPSAAPKIVRVEPRNEITAFLRNTSPTHMQRAAQMERATASLDRELRLGGTRVVVTTQNGESWEVRTGADPKVMTEPSQIGSLTKTFTTTVIMQLKDEGRLELDDEIGDLGLGFRHGRITIRQLLSHTSGIPEYDRTSGLLEDGTTPADVVYWASRRPLEFRPGSRVKYSTTGFVLLGVVLERLTGSTFEDLVERRITDDLGYGVSFFRGRYRSVGFSTGGLSMTPSDLADWTRRYFRDRNVGAAPWEWSFRSTTGLGAHGYCPCRQGSFMALGHMGGRTFASVDGDGVVVVIDSRGVLVNDNYGRVQQLAQELRLIAGGGRNHAYP